MTDRELKKLTRPELLELILMVSNENEELRQQVAGLQKQLEETVIPLQAVGSITEAAKTLTGIFEAAQTEADHILSDLEATAGASDENHSSPPRRGRAVNNRRNRTHNDKSLEK